MARIHGPSNGHATLTGTSGNDRIIADGDANTILGGGGDDTILATSGNYNSISVGALSDGLSSFTDRIHINGLYDTVGGGDENVMLYGIASSSTVTFGNGSDTVSLIGANNTLSFGAGNDAIRVLGGNNAVLLTGFTNGTSDGVTVSGAHNSVINSQYNSVVDTDDTLLIKGGSGNGTFMMGIAGGTIVTGGVDNFIQGGYADTKIVAGSGHDTVSLLSGFRGILGTAQVLLAGTHNLVTGSTNAAIVTGGAGYDTISLSPGSNAVAGYQITDAGTHDNIFLNAGIGANIDGGSSFEHVSLVSSDANVTFAGTGDTLTLSGDEVSSSYPTATVTDLSQGLQITLERTSQSPVGNLTIYDFDPTGVINIDDGRGGFTSAAQAFADVKNNGTSHAYLVMPDGSGTITFLNDSHLTVANFHLGSSYPGG